MLNLIIADDELLVLNHLAEIVHWEDYGIKLTGIYTNGRQVMEHIISQPTDIIICDLKMPFYDGLQIARYCFENLPNTKVILISAFREFEYAQSAMKYSVNSYITKPFTKQNILDALLNVIKKKNSRADIIDSFSRYIEYQTVFSDIFCGNINTEEEISNIMKILELSCSCGKVMRFETLNFTNYIDEKWRYGELRFFNAISTLSFSKTHTSCFSVVGAKSNEFVILAISENDDEINNYTDRLIQSLKSILNVECKLHSFEEFHSLMELIGYFNTSPVEGNDFMQTVNAFIEKNYSKDISLDDIAGVLCLNKTYFCALYKKYTNETFVETLKRIRLEKAKDLLINSTVKVSMIYELVGYKSKPYFYKLFKEQVGITPAEYRQIYGNFKINDI